MVIDLSGHRYGALTVLRCFGKRSKRIAWLCRCDCKRETIVFGCHLRSGHTVSCGCRRIATTSLVGKSNATHGHTRGRRISPEFRTWMSMLNRCGNPRGTNYHQYGGRGIQVCERWHVFETFLEDMGPRPTPTHSIDRINNNGHYEPGNCRWATKSEQSRNQRSNRLLTVGGRTQTLTAWAEEMGIKADTIGHRLRYDGCPSKQFKCRPESEEL